MNKVKVYVSGWLNYYCIAIIKRRMQEWDEWLRRRFRQYIWKQWTLYCTHSTWQLKREIFQGLNTEKRWFPKSLAKRKSWIPVPWQWGTVYNVIERVNREIKRRTRVIGTFHDGESALMLVCARLRYIVSNDWCKKHYLNMKHLTDMLAEERYCEAKIS